MTRYKCDTKYIIIVNFVDKSGREQFKFYLLRCSDISKNDARIKEWTEEGRAKKIIEHNDNNNNLGTPKGSGSWFSAFFRRLILVVVSMISRCSPVPMNITSSHNIYASGQTFLSFPSTGRGHGLTRARPEYETTSAPGRIVYDIIMISYSQCRRVSRSNNRIAMIPTIIT